ncbi:RnhB protein [Leptolyngbya boryana NIES-2135]|jgi:ribonuclease HII|uniref:Ribonuclease HII n=1 Tax=Leptolyngbya boryana NIES-2135 TaxID=1973484 RepID=A0A1Z4JI85_LEPBY|nr:MULTISPECIES: ribonuclease HII [Leptolyngbya]BAY56472.1 RnhB protein [Leptolyngbya boryana NIES-2135]MBD2371200.1 ribonuclease HII [Leptolyngbya sp. FACHB-161]MBD2377653.1 ribonuclease HII [Leptolyngbya sp. FACHB-238]MBD2402105.1 ribonuclease HII [Leptolyngbya sp. FACHB-239]MBD2408625.1 ribonuclease HII [Leptolyngbya sp. FACHB-402]
MPQNPTLEIEQSLWKQGLLRIAGVDEAGLGCLAGPIVAATVLLPVHCEMIAGVRDSKLLSASQRERLFDIVKSNAIAIGVGIATVREIEQINVLRASYLAMQRALSRVAPYDHALIDGRPIRQTALGSHTAIIDGDATCYAIASASIIAKVRRDRFMRRLAQRYPGYGWEKNAGYGTKQHLAAIQSLGITPYHRKTYAPVQKVIQQFELNLEA